MQIYLQPKRRQTLHNANEQRIVTYPEVGAKLQNTNVKICITQTCRSTSPQSFETSDAFECPQVTTQIVLHQSDIQARPSQSVPRIDAHAAMRRWHVIALLLPTHLKQLTVFAFNTPCVLLAEFGCASASLIRIESR